MCSDQTIILDGGMGRELERIGAPFSQPFWSAQALIEAPETVSSVHRNFIRSGAQIITTNSYAVVPSHIGEDLFQQRGRELIALSGKLARNEADDAPRQPSFFGAVKVAACVPPVFGSYQPDNFKPDQAAALISMFFEEQELYADLFLAETISSIEEALSVMKVYREFGSDKPLWLAFTLKELFDETSQPQIRSGELLYDALQSILQQGMAQAILLNCCSVEDISAGFNSCDQLIRNHADVKFGAYANVFGKVKEKRSPTRAISALREDISPKSYLEYARKWKQQGASIIGGCCGIGPEYIQILSKGLID